MTDWSVATLDTPLFSLSGLKTHARVVSIYDADTITVVMLFAGKFTKFNLRLYGIDTPEMKSKDITVRDKANKARDRVVQLITNTTLPTKKDVQAYLAANIVLVYIECFDQDKWGRTLAQAYIKQGDAKSISDILLEEKLAYPYFGETKLTEEQQIQVLS